MQRLEREQAKFSACENVHDLPDIFHYWSNKFLAPALHSFGYASPVDFFERCLEARCKWKSPQIVRAISIGSGNCDLEATIAANLVGRGISNFKISCLDINADMIARGESHARDLGVGTQIDFLRNDFNSWKGGNDEYDIIIANQSLHHVLELEHLLDAVHRSLAENGQFLISDMIGRNGHMRWPEALEAMRPFWEEMPPSYRINRQISRQEDTYINHDCSVSSFEGIRAQDILPLLCERFGFEFFFPYGNIIFPFIDRAFGHNFQADEEWDRDFIDRVHARDEELMLNGGLKPTSLVAVATRGKTETALRDPRLTPEFCVREP